MMAKEAKKPRADKRDLVGVMLPRDLGRMLRAIAGHSEKRMDEVLERLAGDAIRKEFKKVHAELAGG